jgi:hypothetical protein
MKSETKNLFDKSVHTELIERINKIDPSAAPQWGKMSPGQMFAHLCETYKSSMANQPLKRSFIGIVFGKIAKRSFTGEKGFKPGLPTDKNFVITESRNFEKEKENLLRLIRQFSEGGPTVVSKHKHPFFGKMTVDEWNALMYKHTDHHLRQFGV